MANVTISRYYYHEACLNAARSFVSTSSMNKDYFVYASSNYQVTVLVGDFDFSDWSFTNVSVYKFSYITPHDGSSNFYISFSQESSGQSGSISNPDRVLTYCNAAYQPQLIDRGGVYLETASLYGIALLLLFFVIRDIFSNVSRH